MKPLYDSLKSDIEVDCRDILSEQKEELIQNIKSLDEKGSELLLVLIKLYEIDKEK